MSSSNAISLVYLYPDLLSLHGDRGNIWAFGKAAENIGINLSVSRIDSVERTGDLSGFDIVLMSPGELSTAQYLAGALKEHKAAFEEHLAKAKPMVVIGTTIAAFASECTRLDGSKFSGLGFVDASLTELSVCYSNDSVLACELFGEQMEVVGGQIQIVRVSLGKGETPLGINEYGYGNDKGMHEGILKGSFVFTNLLGPVFVKNPWFAEAILLYAARQKGIAVEGRKAEYELERMSNDEIKRFIDIKVAKHDHSRLDHGKN
ncbi:MAG: hypothetical protein FWG30_07690 [Eubacteriaceae bacterium]|jgi:CobQ-like glutamine amidotransferase family enzyme|nr:hypothetical protein [Eubacteriaceae bacterium]